MRPRIAALLTAMTALSPSTLTKADVYVVTAKENTQKLSMDDVQGFFKLEKQEWPDGKKIILAVPEIDSPEGAAMLSKIYDFSKEKYKKFWLERVFRGVVPSPPETKSGASLKEFLKSYPNAIGIIQGSQADASVNKALKLD